ncbi:MAG TPA: FtsX-like permease family protein [Terriglobia bacterium]
MIQSYSSMFLRVGLRSLAVKRPQSALAFAALALGATVASLLLNLYGDARRKMQDEFRSYGPNVIVAPSRIESAARTGEMDAAGNPGGLLDAAITAQIQGKLQSLAPGAPKAIMAPVLYAVVSARPGKLSNSTAPALSMVAVGAAFAALRALNPAWKGSDARDEAGPGSCVLGSSAAERLGLRPGDSLELAALETEPAAAYKAGRAMACTLASLVSSGGAEDNQVFLPLDVLQQLVGLAGRISLVEMHVPGATADVEAVVSGLAPAFPSLEIRPVQEIVQSEGKVLSIIRGLMLALAALIIGVVVLCVMATVTTIILERCKEVGVMKALGASDRTVFGLLLTEVGALGLAAGIVGFAFGALLARRLGVDLFGVALDTDWQMLLPVIAAAVLVAALSALVPVSTVRGIDPARTLRGE